MLCFLTHFVDSATITTKNISEGLSPGGAGAQEVPLHAFRASIIFIFSYGLYRTYEMFISIDIIYQNVFAFKTDSFSSLLNISRIPEPICKFLYIFLNCKDSFFYIALHFSLGDVEAEKTENNKVRHPVVKT
jgi:hypothetical protein